MKQKFLLFMLIFISVTAYGQQFDSIYGKPLIVLTEYDPWAMVIGSDVPSFALYENGQIIYSKIKDSSLKIYEVLLNETDLQNVIKSLDISNKIYKLPGNIEASIISDQPTNELILNFDSVKTISVYGYLDGISKARSKTPEIFLNVYDNIKKFESDSAKE